VRKGIKVDDDGPETLAGGSLQMTLADALWSKKYVPGNEHRGPQMRSPYAGNRDL